MANKEQEKATEEKELDQQSEGTDKGTGEADKAEEVANNKSDKTEEQEPAEIKENAPAPEASDEPKSTEEPSTATMENAKEQEASVSEESAEESTAPASQDTPNNNKDNHEDFDWDMGKRSDQIYSDEEWNKLEQLYDSTLQTITENEIVKGTIVGVTTSDVVLNVGFKSDGLVPLSEFRDVEDLKEGDEVEVYVVEKEDAKGHLVLSRKNAKLMRAWEDIVESYTTDKILTGTITSKTKGGLIVNILGLETFLPGSQIDVKPIIDYDAFVGKKMEFKVVKINEAIKNAVVSHKALIESDLESQRQEIISKLDEGQVLEGIVKNITDFGAFIDLGGVDGLLYITDISWGRINHPSEVLELNQKVNVVVLSFDDEKKRISLGLKQLQPHPWDVLDEKLDVGSKIKGKVVNIEDYGAFLEITPGVEGLVHVSEVSWSNQPINSKDYFTLGETHEAVVMTIDREERKMSLSIKRLLPDPWEKIKEKYPDGSQHTGLVQNITPYGVFVELEEGIGGMIHISDLSWTKRYSHPSEFTKVGDELQVVVLEIDIEERKLTLGHKQLEEDPWDTFESVFPVASVHEGTVIRKEENGAIVQLPYGLEGFAPNRHLRKEDGKSVVADETLNFKVIEFDRKDKKIILSHTKYLEDLKNESLGEGPTTEKRKTGKPAKASGRKMEKTTLGDIEELAALKENLEKEEKDTASTSKSKKKAEAESKAKATEEVAEKPAKKTSKSKKDSEKKADTEKEAEDTPKKEEAKTEKAPEDKADKKEKSEEKPDEKNEDEKGK